MKLYRFKILASSIICSISALAVNDTDHARIANLVAREIWAQEVVEGIKENLNPYISESTDWLSSRLCMYWDTHATDVYINGETYSHAGGEVAPVPTVVFTGSRGHATKYKRPSLNEIKPYEEDARGMYLRNSQLSNEPYEWAAIGQTGRMIESINVEILNKARDAAFIYWLTGEKQYGDIAAKVLDTYLLGLYYRNVPIDLNNGHQQTLVGMTSFEVIHEDAISVAVQIYDFMRGYIGKYLADNDGKYQAALKKCADNIINHGVPHNNWDLIQARYIMNIALVLGDDSCYNDHKGRQYYIDRVVNTSSLRQWSLKTLAEYGFDSSTGVWGECPGYSSGVIGDFCSFACLFDEASDIDLIKEIPVIERAVSVMPQYLYPNRIIVGFGDTHPSQLNTAAMTNMVRHAQHRGDKEKEKYFTSMLKLFNLGNNIDSNRSISVGTFFASSPVDLDANVSAAEIDSLVTPTFYAPNVSWLVQRNGMNPQNSLMISLNGSLGNHMHANGISMELYGKGYTLAPDAGIGTSLYQGLDYLEYYSQFPSHNTVCVDGISSYPVMMSNHAFRVNALYPKSGYHTDYKPESYSEVSFNEPESGAEQLRLNSIIATSDTTGYYVDIFRSRKSDNSDKFHDYFYHNLGQEVAMTNLNGDSIDLQSTEELAFAGGHLYAYSYIYNQKVADDSNGRKTVFKINREINVNIMMTMWSRGDSARRTFTALSPMTEGLSRLQGMPYNISKQPTLTFVSRQRGEAWYHPFVSVFEPSTTLQPGLIDAVEFPEASEGSVIIKVMLKDGATDIILSNDSPDRTVQYGDLALTGTYLVAHYDSDNNLKSVFLGNAKKFRYKKLKVESPKPVDLRIEKSMTGWNLSDSPEQLKVSGML